MEEENIKNQETNTPGKIPKYSVVLRFWSTPQKIEVDDIVSCRNKFTNAFYYKFFDSTGRLWDNVPESDVIIVKNLPDKEDIEDFSRIKHETIELQNKLKNTKSDIIDVSIR